MNIIFLRFKLPYRLMKAQEGVKHGLFSYQYCRPLRCYIFSLRQFLVVIPADESGQVAAISPRGSCRNRLEWRHRWEPEENNYSTSVAVLTKHHTHQIGIPLSLRNCACIKNQTIIPTYLRRQARQGKTRQFHLHSTPSTIR